MYPRIWVASSEKVPSNMRKMQRFRSFCACAKSHSIHTVCIVSNDSFADSQGPDHRASAQSDLGLHCPHISDSKAHLRLDDSYGHPAVDLGSKYA